MSKNIKKNWENNNKNKNDKLIAPEIFLSILHIFIKIIINNNNNTKGIIITKCWKKWRKNEFLATSRKLMIFYTPLKDYNLI